MLLNIDLHTHTNRYSKCSVLSPEALCETALARGLNALAITEHGYQWTEREIEALQARYPALKLYAGVEISCQDRRDYVVLGLEVRNYAPNPMPYEQLQALLDAHPGAFAYIAHCFRHNDREEGLAECKIDGIEMGSYNIVDRHQPSTGPIVLRRGALYDKWQDKMGWIGLYNSDGHSVKMVGTFFNQIESADGMPPDEAALIHLLRRAEVRGVQNEALIREAVRWRA